LQGKHFLPLLRPHGDAIGTHSKLDNQFANQIVINLKVAVIKFKQFKIAIWFIIATLLTPVGAFILAKVKL
jgi:hypothetical protein